MAVAIVLVRQAIATDGKVEVLAVHDRPGRGMGLRAVGGDAEADIDRAPLRLGESVIDEGLEQ